MKPHLNFLKFFGLFAVILMMVGCQTVSLSGLQAFSVKRDFHEYLATGYLLLAEYEAFVEEDGISAAKFQEKSDLARKKVAIEPTKVPFMDLDSKAVKELVNARDILINSFSYMKNNENERALAEAQVNFDCWVDRLLNDKKSAEYCKQSFYDALAKVKAGQSSRYSVFFNKGKAIPDAAGNLTIKKAATTYQEQGEKYRLYVTGHTDPNGNKNENLVLSMRRALAVRNALAQNGVELDKIVVTAVGEDDELPAGIVVDSPEDLRRVDITIEPVTIDHSGENDQIKAIAPHYFAN